MDDLARSVPERRAELFRETAARMGIRPLIVEKDFWVCWALSRIFDPASALPPLVFKGGTSLSKAYGLIERFSEDIDLAFDREALGFGGDNDPLTAPSRKQASKRCAALDRACLDLIRDALMPFLAGQLRELTDRDNTLQLDEGARAIRVAYPRALEDPNYGALGYISPSVLLEFGARSDQSPAEHVTIEPYAAQHFPGLFERRSTPVVVLAAKRTFWEKATLLHVEPGRPSESRPRSWARLSRHAYDLYMLSRQGVAREAIADLHLLEQVARHKSVFFPSGWADYDSAVPGTLRLAPAGEFADALRSDYRDMREMLFGEAPSWEEILDELAALEAAINNN